MLSDQQLNAFEADRNSQHVKTLVDEYRKLREMIAFIDGGENEIIKVPKRLIPAGARLVEAYETDREIIVIGEPDDEPEGLNAEEYARWYETAHNCDAMGCTSVSHVMYRFRKVGSSPATRGE